MLWSLYIENIAVAKQLEINFTEGFTVITGQTGAGKSIIIDSLLLLCGSKNGRELIRTGEDKATVSAVFSCSNEESDRLSELGYPPDENGEIEIARHLSSDGRSSAKINRKTVPVSALREIAPILLSVQTQNERNSFADKSSYVSYLDLYAETVNELSEYGKVYKVLCEKKNALSYLLKSLEEKDMMTEILTYQKKEIDSAKLTDDDEEEKLMRLRAKLKSYEKVSKYTSVVTKALVSSEKGITAAYLLERAEAALLQLTETVEGAAEMAAKLEGYRYEIIDIAERVSDSLDGDDLGDPAEKLKRVEDRLGLIGKLERKYGTSIKEIKAKREEISKKLSDLSSGEDRVCELEREIADFEKKATELASKLSEKRKAAAEILSAQIVSSLRQLDMPKVRFKISVTPMRDQKLNYVFAEDGFDDVDFLFSANSGEDMNSLGKVSSGGELSRITLAMKTALSDKIESGTIIFDEIDAGVSGATSERIGVMLDKLSENIQVISVTHSPQIASIAKNHLLIEKNETDGRTESHVRTISGEERTKEISRIIGGISVTEKQIAAAREMLTKYSN